MVITGVWDTEMSAAGDYCHFDVTPDQIKAFIEEDNKVVFLKIPLVTIGEVTYAGGISAVISVTEETSDGETYTYVTIDNGNGILTGSIEIEENGKIAYFVER